MYTTVDQLSIGEKAIIIDFDIDAIPLKLIELGCLTGNTIEILQIAPFGDPLFLNMNDCHLSIRLETACKIRVETIKK